MKSLAVIFLAAAAIALAGCAATNNTSNKDAGVSNAELRAQIDLLKSELNDVRSDVKGLKVDLIGLQAKVAELNHTGGTTASGSVKLTDFQKKLLETAGRLSDNPRVWAGSVKGVSFIVMPVTKKDELQVFRDELGNDYAYLWLQIINSDKNETTFKFEPTRGLFKVEVEEEKDGKTVTKYYDSFDPREIVKTRRATLGVDLACGPDFAAKTLMPGETMQTHILLPKSVDLSKIKTLYMSSVEIRELKQ